MLTLMETNTPPPTLAATPSAAATEASPPRLVHFIKANLSNQIIIKGRRVNFDPVGNNWGVIRLNPDIPEDQAFIESLNLFASKGVGGIGKITAEEYAQKKSQGALTPSGRPKEMLRLRPTGPQRRAAPQQNAGIPAGAAAVAGANKAAPNPAPESVEPALDLANLKPASEVGGTSPIPESFRPPTRRIQRNKSTGAPKIPG